MTKVTEFIPNVKVLRIKDADPHIHAYHYSVYWAMLYNTGPEPVSHSMLATLMGILHEAGSISDDDVLSMLAQYGREEFEWGWAPEGECGLCTLRNEHGPGCIRAPYEMTAAERYNSFDLFNRLGGLV